MNKSFLNKLSLFLMLLCGLFVFIPNYVVAATVTQMEHKTNVSVDKVWQIKFNQGINKDKLSDNVKVYNATGAPQDVKISYDSINNTITVEPVLAYIPGQTYSLQIYETITDLNSNPLKETVTMNFTIAVSDNGPLIDTVNKKYVYKPYNNTLDQMVNVESKANPPNYVANYNLDASDIDISEYLNPKNFLKNDNAVYQFLTLNYIEGITAEDLNMELGGVLAGKGEMFLDTCKKYNVNPAYVVAHALLETGHGTSELATGIEVSEVKGVPVVECKLTYNMFGIGAADIDPNKLGSEKAYTEGWFTPDLAIEGGIEWIASQYINNSTYKQNTLYKMRWNPAIPANGTYRHQYATDIAWAYKQSYIIKEILDKYKNACLVFEIPQYK